MKANDAVGTFFSFGVRDELQWSLRLGDEGGFPALFEEPCGAHTAMKLSP